MHDKKMYITTPIYYVTAKPHLGSLYSTLLADYFARWYKLRGNAVRMVTGTDEHGQKVAQAASQAGAQPKAFVDQFVPAFKSAWDQYEIRYERFIRTTDEDHLKAVHTLINTLRDTGDIYKAEYTGWYCTPCETFLTDVPADAHEPACPSCGRATKYVSETAYFFKLSAYQERLLKWYAHHPNFIVPHERAQEVISFVTSGLKDLCISRSTVKWGIPFPHDPEHTVYVWVEALCNYLTAAGYPDHLLDHHWWPADMHILGKDIIRFHAVYWPALLMAADLPLPKQLLVHGWITVDTKKMSKSLDNVVDPVMLAKEFDVDVIRYYLLRTMPINQDGDFSIASLEQHQNADLANDLGNLAQRMLVLASKYNITTLTPPDAWSSRSLELRDAGYDMVNDVINHVDERMVHQALIRIWRYVHLLNSYFHEHEPWKLAARDPKAFHEVLSAVAHGLHTVAILLLPVMPRKMETLLQSLGKHATIAHEHDHIAHVQNLSWHESYVLTQMPVLFPKREVTVIVDAKPDDAKKSVTEQKPKIKEPEAMATIGIDTFAAVHLVVGTIVDASTIPNSDKLLKLQVDCGSYGMRQILSGVRAWYTPEQIIGKQAIFVCNLANRMMMGIESQGMMVCAKDPAGHLTIATVGAPVANGTRLS